ncbi:hypothetical protein [Undibacterium curvum]|uniref:hypothetical protein n=1 Tax=Undibacterium curvum TaxID=2762294 RepID=UPI003D125A97
MKMLLGLLTVCTLSACSSLENQAANQSKAIADDADYVTGSNIRQRNRQIQTLTPSQAEDLKRGSIVSGQKG